MALKIFIFLHVGLSTVQTQLKHFKPDCLFLPVSHLFLVQPILQIITSPPRQTFSIRMQGGTVHSLHCKALKILGFVENNVIPLIEENQTKVRSAYMYVMIASDCGGNS